MRVVPYTPGHDEEIRAVCIEQANERARQEEAYRRFTLLMYCDAYLKHGIAYLLLDDDDVVRGYTLAAEDVHQWLSDFAPYREKIEALGPEYAERVARELAFYETVADDYPAHLHIDISEDFTGGGYGRKLMQALLERLRDDGVKGVAFGVAPKNERAIGFYRHMGFEPLGDPEQCAVFCRSF